MANIEFTPPIRGINKGLPADKPVVGTSEHMNNVRPVGAGGRILIVQRPPLGKWGAGTQIGAEEQPVVALCTISSVV